MVARVVPAVAGVHVVPLFVVNRNSHFSRIAVIQAIAALEILLPVEILRIVNIRVVVEAVPVAVVGLTTPGASVSSLVGGGRLSDHAQAA